MTDNSDDMLLARLGEVGCQERTHIESHLTEHNRGLAEIQQEWENTLMLYFSTVMEKGKTQQEWEEVGRNTPNVGKNTKRGGMRGIKMGCLAAVSTLSANPFGNLLEFQI